jgi:hypothetical protein
VIYAPHRSASIAAWLLRLALAVSFLSAVADRFGLRGAPGDPGVAWGDWPHFLDYVASRGRRGDSYNWH